MTIVADDQRLAEIAALAIGRVRREPAQDHIGEGWLVARELLGSFDPTRGVPVGAYIGRAARYHAIDGLRRELGRLKRRPEPHVPESVSQDDRIDTVETARQCRIGERLGEELRLHSMGLTYQQIAAARDIPPGTAQSRAFHQLRKLRTAMGTPAGSRCH